jgi:hypothetical protein
MARPNKAPVRNVSLLGRIWDKTYWIFGTLFLGLTFWIWSRFGEWNLLRLFAVVLVVAGAYALACGMRGRRLAEESRHWLPVRARIVRSEVTKEYSKSLTDSPNDYTVFYFPEIEYEYEVQGQIYHSDRLIAVQVNFSGPDAEAWVAKYPAGAVVTARRHPEKPELSVLEPGIAGFESEYRIPFIVGSVFVALGAIGLVVVSLVT